MESIDVFAPLASLQWVDRNTIHANDYNPNKVSEENLKLLIQSILTNGWTLPIVVRPDGTIIDGFHRWTVSGREPLLSLLGGKVPVVVVDHHGDESADVYGTITHNRARGTHLLEPMKAIVKKLIDEGKTVEEIGKQLGMKPEEIFRLSGFTKDDFLNMMTKGHDTYSKAQSSAAYEIVLASAHAGRGFISRKGIITMDYYDFVASAIAAVASLYNANAELAHLQKIGVKDVCVLWCGSTLQNNKAWLSTTVPDCMYYEATYDGDKKELRLDAYRKIQSVSIPC